MRKYIVLHSFVHSFISYLHCLNISRRILIIQIRKIIHKVKAKQTVGCVWPIDKEIANKFCCTWLKQQHIELKTTSKLGVLSYILLVPGRTYILHIITEIYCTYMTKTDDWQRLHRVDTKEQNTKNYHHVIFLKGS